MIMDVFGIIGFMFGTIGFVLAITHRPQCPNSRRTLRSCESRFQTDPLPECPFAGPAALGGLECGISGRARSLCG